MKGRAQYVVLAILEIPGAGPIVEAAPLRLVQGVTLVRLTSHSLKQTLSSAREGGRELSIPLDPIFVEIVACVVGTAAATTR
jgi:hypothetical protein